PVPQPAPVPQAAEAEDPMAVEDPAGVLPAVGAGRGKAGAPVKELDFYLKYRSLGDDYLSLQDKEKYLDFMKDRLEKLRTKFLKQSRKKKIIDVIIFLLFELDKDEEAYGYIKILQDLHPIYKEVYYWKVVLKIRKGDYESARRTYKEALKRYSDFFEMYDWVETNLNREKVKEILKV
ncbi:MAG: hypothetical protein ACHQYO_05175, partial [Halanaerobiales bacterium]